MTPFRIAVPQRELDDLRRRLAEARLPDPLPGDGWDTGVPIHYLRTLVDHWLNSFDWRRIEADINRHDQFVTDVDGQRIHLIHVRSRHEDATPLILTHGWPGSIVDFLDLIGPLTDPTAHGGTEADAFHVVIPSLPGFGFSGAVTRHWSDPDIAGAWLEIMTRLGYDRFVAHGGDLGSGVSAAMGRIAPDRLIAIHVNGGTGVFPTAPMPEEELASLSPLERDRMARIQAFMNEEFGYIAIQSTRPQTLAYGLTDSPVGQLAWILDKFREWTHPRETEPHEIIGIDRILTTVMFYWLNRAGGSAAYVGYAGGADWGVTKEPSGVPTAVLVLAHDVAIRRFEEAENTITRWTDVDRGGHFAALEEPDLLVSDLREFVGSLALR